MAPRYHYVQQNTTEWEQLRCGMVTASKDGAGSIISPKTLVLSESNTARKTLHRIVGEILTGRPKDTPETAAMRWGHKYQADATELAELHLDIDIRQCGFVSSGEHELIGCSPDGLIGDDGVFEAKCPQHVENHLKVALTREIPNDSNAPHLIQLLTQMVVTERDYGLYVSYHPWIDELPIAHVAIRVEREAVQPQLLKVRDALLQFAEQVHNTLTRLRRAI